MKALFVLLQYLVPQHALSRCTGWLAGLRHPVWLKNWGIRCFIRIFEVDMSEAAESQPEAYASFNAFFTRALREDLRPLADADIVCPVDGRVSQIGQIEESSLFQAKGHHYSTWALLGGDDERAAWFRNGEFATIYLSPQDYHRVHMPIDGELLATTYIPGKLFSVNPTTAAGVDRLFARNERLVCYFDTAAGPMAMILVGAMVVAGIDTVWSGQVTPPPRRPMRSDYQKLPEPVKLARGEEMGRFQLGSTVILLFPEARMHWVSGYGPESRTRLGEALGNLGGRAAS
ncbi:phosphatidylserine decarboxylase [Kineobactrum sediminis]|uniref:Phosphatidylserine decarboxylase proenzyme n=1 Tax=Kineobactrum sediminis TaxID=1905677 RepID=A0A2N5Y0E6_9GAMM|nr:archaetidylserine decarboxylase [Kineobactrum sediminis]PLW81829.1 phosphatidylserine decarboxylase [Kineobactrum sediminis]